MTPVARREAVARARAAFDLSERRACSALGFDRSSARYRGGRADDAGLRGRLRDECLNETLFRGLGHARAVLSAWRDDYNHVRPHGALRGLTPARAAELARGINGEHNANPGLQP